MLVALFKSLHIQPIIQHLVHEPCELDNPRSPHERAHDYSSDIRLFPSMFWFIRTVFKSIGLYPRIGYCRGKKNAKNGTVRNSDGASTRTCDCSPGLRSTSNRSTSIASNTRPSARTTARNRHDPDNKWIRTAYKIGNKTITQSATISLSAKVVKSNPGRGMLNFTGGTLTLTSGEASSNTYTVVSGHGIITYHSDKMVLHLVVKDSAGNTFRLILFGVHAKASSTTAFNVDFRMPQSKLAHLWFLKFPSASVTP